MGLARCPKCGALNAVRQRMCPQCETPLCPEPVEVPAAPLAAAPGAVCKACKHATVFPPVGVRLTPQDVWCALVNVRKPADGDGGECFSPSFTWRREERLD